MADWTTDAPAPRRARGWEYHAYYAPILALSVPPALVRAATAIVTSDPAPRPGVWEDARQRARDVTTTICSL